MLHHSTSRITRQHARILSIVHRSTVRYTENSHFITGQPLGQQTRTHWMQLSAQIDQSVVRLLWRIFHKLLDYQSWNYIKMVIILYSYHMIFWTLARIRNYDHLMHGLEHISLQDHYKISFLCIDKRQDFYLHRLLKYLVSAFMLWMN